MHQCAGFNFLLRKFLQYSSTLFHTTVRTAFLCTEKGQRVGSLTSAAFIFSGRKIQIFRLVLHKLFLFL